MLSFLDLPAEVRVLIYRELHAIGHIALGSGGLTQMLIHPRHALYLVSCHPRIRRDVSPTMLDRLQLSCGDFKPHYADFLSLGHPTVRFVTHLDLTIAKRHGYESNSLYLIPLEKMLQSDLPNLHEVTLSCGNFFDRFGFDEGLPTEQDIELETEEGRTVYGYQSWNKGLMEMLKQILPTAGGMNHVFRIPAMETGEVRLKIQREDRLTIAEQPVIELDIEMEIERINRWSQGQLALRLDLREWEDAMHGGYPEFIYRYSDDTAEQAFGEDGE